MQDVQPKSPVVQGRKMDLLAFAGEVEIWTDHVQKSDWKGAASRLKFIENEAACLCSDQTFLAAFGSDRPDVAWFVRFLATATKLGELTA